MASAKTDEKARRRARRSWGSISAADRRLRRRPSTRNCDALISVSSPPPSLSDPAGSGAPSGWPRRENRFGQREAVDRVERRRSHIGDDDRSRPVGGTMRRGDFDGALRRGQGRSRAVGVVVRGRRLAHFGPLRFPRCARTQATRAKSRRSTRDRLPKGRSRETSTLRVPFPFLLRSKRGAKRARSIRQRSV